MTVLADKYGPGSVAWEIADDIMDKIINAPSLYNSDELTQYVINALEAFKKNKEKDE